MGETGLIVRSHSGSADEVVRWMRHDSLGRLVLNAEPNTSTKFRRTRKLPDKCDPGATPTTMRITS